MEGHGNTYMEICTIIKRGMDCHLIYALGGSYKLKVRFDDTVINVLCEMLAGLLI